MTTVGIMQPYLFPYLGYFQLIHAVDTFVIYDDVQYIKGGWVNRNRLLIRGSASLFSFSVHDDAHDKVIGERRYAGAFPREAGKFLKTLTFAYGKSPYFGSVMPLMCSFVEEEERNIARLNTKWIQRVCDYLRIGTTFVASSDLQKDNGLAGESRVIDISMKLGAERYINAIGGKGLYSPDSFARHGITLQFLRPRGIRYEQFGGPFVPDLSIVDVLMFNHPEEVRRMLQEYDLVEGVEQ